MRLRIIIIIVSAIAAIVAFIINRINPKKVPLIITIVFIVILLFTAALEIIENKRQSTKETTEKYAGVLKSRSFVLISSDPRTFPAIEIADTGLKFVFGGGVDENFISRVLEDNNFKIEIEDGQIKVSMVIRDKEGNVVTIINKNEWKMNPGKLFDRNFSENALEIIDQKGEIILQVRLLGNCVQLQGKFYSSKDTYKSGLKLGKDVIGIEIGRFSEKGNYPGGIHFLGRDTPSSLLNKPIFKYPSELHIGELLDKRDK